MGWWFRKDPQTPVFRPEDSTPDPIPTASEPPASTRELTDQPTRLTSADKELEKELWKYLNTNEEERSNRSRVDGNPSSSPPSTLPQNAATTPGTKSSTNDRVITPDRLYPDTMSCSDAFNRAFYCQSIGGQFMNVYRHGELRECADNWSEFWFCMKTRSQPEDTKRKNIRSFYAERDAKYKDKPSSEDVWEKRLEMNEKAFDLNPDEATSASLVE